MTRHKAFLPRLLFLLPAYYSIGLPKFALLLILKSFKAERGLNSWLDLKSIVSTELQFLSTSIGHSLIV